MKEAIAFLLLCLPVIMEVVLDRNGDKDKAIDVFFRGGAMLFVSAFPFYFLGHSYFASLFLSFAIFFLVFDYAINYVLIRRGVVEVPGAHWFSYMGKASWTDNILVWHNLSAKTRFYIKLGVFVSCLIWYVYG